MDKGNIEKKNLSVRTKSGFAWLLSGSSVQAVMQVLFTAVLARLLSPSDFGLLASAMIVIGFADLFSQMGVGPALVQTRDLTEEKISTAFAFSIGLGVVLIILFLLINPFIVLFFEMPKLLPILNVLVFLFPIKSFTQLSFSLLQRDFEFKKLAGLDVISYIVGYGFIGILSAYLGYGVWALVYGIMCQSMIYGALLYIRKPHKLALKINKLVLKELFTFGKGFTLTRLYNYVALKVDYLVVGKILGAESLGFYSRAYALMNAPNNIVGKVMNVVFFANFSEIKDNNEQISKTINTSFRILLLFVIPISSFCWSTSTEIIYILLGSQWASVILPFKILAFGMIFRLGYKLPVTMLMGIGRVDLASKSQLFYMVVVVSFSLLGCYYGISGVAIGIDLALLLTFCYLVLLIKRFVDFSFFTLIRLSLIPLLVSFLFFVLHKLVFFFLEENFNVFIRLLISLVLLGTSYVVILYKRREKVLSLLFR